MRSLVCIVFFATILVPSGYSQEKAAVGFPGERARVFVTDSKSWEMTGGGGGTNAGFGGATRGGARPQTAEIIKTFGERCPEVVVNNKQEKADYVVLLDHEGGKGLIRRDNKVAVFNKDGDTIVSRSTRSLGNAVKDACDAIAADWPSRRVHSEGPVPVPATATSKTPPGASENPRFTEIEVVSSPQGADLELDGNFVGNTPSTIRAAAGQHQVVVRKVGFQTWERSITVSGGLVRLNAELESAK